MNFHGTHARTNVGRPWPQVRSVTDADQWLVALDFDPTSASGLESRPLALLTCVRVSEIDAYILLLKVCFD